MNIEGIDLAEKSVEALRELYMSAFDAGDDLEMSKDELVRTQAFLLAVAAELGKRGDRRGDLDE